MTPCKKCGSYNMYSAWDDKETKYDAYLVLCGECDNESQNAESYKQAWKNWETENEINHNITEE